MIELPFKIIKNLGRKVWPLLRDTCGHYWYYKLFIKTVTFTFVEMRRLKQKLFVTKKSLKL